MILGIDLGTASVLVYVKGRGIVLSEPSVVAIDRNTEKVVAVGEQARQMLGKTPANIVAIRPIRDGVIADYEVTEVMLRYFIKRVGGKSLRFIRPSVMVCVPAEVTSVERRAVIEAALSAGAKKAVLIEEPMAAALGAGIDVDEAAGNFVVDIGGGTTDVAVISLGGIVISESVRTAGNKIDEAIVRYIRKKYDMMIGERSAEELKILVGSVYGEKAERFTELRGRDLINGLPKTVKITSFDMAEAVSEPVTAILEAIVRVLEKTPPELSSDIYDKGIYLTGGGALLRGFDKLIAETAGVPVIIAEDPVSCVAVGTGIAALRAHMM